MEVSFGANMPSKAGGHLSNDSTEGKAHGVMGGNTPIPLEDTSSRPQRVAS